MRLSRSESEEASVPPKIGDAFRAKSNTLWTDVQIFRVASVLLAYAENAVFGTKFISVPHELRLQALISFVILALPDLVDAVDVYELSAIYEDTMLDGLPADG